jgi:hypothetical protein
MARTRGIVVALVLALTPGACRGSSSEGETLRREIADLRAENAALRAEVERLKFGLADRETPRNDPRSPWPKGVREAYIERCSKDVVTQGLPPDNAASFCRCFAEGLAAEFGVDEYLQMMQAQPNPNGTEYDRRLYKIITSCRSYLP